MANEITISISGTLNNTSGTGSTRLNRNFQPGQITVDQAAKKRAGKGQDLTQSWEAIDQGDVTSGFVFLTNLDATYNVDFGPLEAGSGGAGVLLGSIQPGDPPAYIPLAAGVTIMARASGGSGATATVDVEIWSR